MLTLLSHLYGQYAGLSATDLAEKDRKIWETSNPDEPLKSLYTRLNKCVDYVTASGKHITEEQVVRIPYSLVAEIG